MSMSTAKTAALYKCLAMTLEMPFKDTSTTPDPVHGWSPERSGRLAESCLQAMINYLHWKKFQARGHHGAARIRQTLW